MSVPIYLEITRYEEVLDAIDVIKTRIIESKQILARLHALREEENEEIHRARQYITEMEETLRRVNQEVFDIT